MNDLFIIKEEKIIFLCSKNIHIGDLVFAPNEEEAGTVIDEKDLAYWKSKNAHKIVYELSTHAIYEGDTVVVEWTDGIKPTGDFLIGVLTKKWDEEPYCFIDNKPIDLAGEGHSSKVYKVV